MPRHPFVLAAQARSIIRKLCDWNSGVLSNARRKRLQFFGY
jgi:hypothetical protein